MKKIPKSIIVSVLSILASTAVAYATLNTTSPRIPVPVDNVPATTYLFDLPINSSGTITLQGAIVGSSTAVYYVDGNRGDAFTANGSYVAPYKTLSSALTASTPFPAYAYWLSPGTYVDGAPDTFPANFVLYGNEATVVEPSGATFPGSFDNYDTTWVGTLHESDQALNSIHQFTNGVIAGNLQMDGLATLEGMSLPVTTDTLSISTGSLTNVVGTDLAVNTVSSGTLNLDDDAIIGSSSAVMVQSTAGSVNLLGATIVNSGAGGGIDARNGATSTPNNINSVSIVTNGGLGINCGTAACVVANITGLTNFAGQFIAPSGTNWTPVYDEDRAVLNALVVGSSTVPASGLQVYGPLVDGQGNKYSTSTASGGTPAGNNNTIQFNNGGAFGGALQFTYSTSTGQLKYTGQASDNPGSSISGGGLVNLTDATDTEALVITDGGIVHNNTNMLYVSITNSSSIQSDVTFASNATSGSVLSIRGTGQFNRGIAKCDGLTTSAQGDANGSCFSADVAETNSSTRQWINLSATHGSSGNFITATNSGTAEFSISSSGIPRFNNLAANSFLATDANSNLITTGTPVSSGGGFTTANASSGIAITTSTSLISIQNTGVTSLTGGSYTNLANSTGSVTLNVSSTLASSTINLTISAPTTTAPSYTRASWDYARTLTKISCVDLNGTTTLSFWNSASFSTTTFNQQITSSTLPCGISGNSTTTFTSSTLLANYALFVQVTSTVGVSPTDTVSVEINSFKL